MNNFAIKNVERPKTVGSDAWNIVRNPFILNNNPKIPDGSTNLSCGQRFTKIKELTVPAVVNDNCITIALFPGFANNIAYNKAEATPNPNENYVCLPMNDTHGRWLMNKCQVIAEVQEDLVAVPPVPASPAYVTINATQNNSSVISKWRCVSSGLKIALLNNAHDNDGWFECARIQMSLNPSDYSLYDAATGNRLAAPTEAQNRIVGPVMTRTAATTTCTTFGVSSGSLPELSSYRTGKLRDIHKYNFTLARNSNAKHDWVKMSQSLPIVTAGGTVAFGYAPVDNAPFVQMNRDPHMDVMIIRIHGKTGQNATASSILLHSVHNLEVVYESGTTGSRFHSEGVMARAALRSTLSRIASPYSRGRSRAYSRPRQTRSFTRVPKRRTQGFRGKGYRGKGRRVGFRK